MRITRRVSIGLLLLGSSVYSSAPSQVDDFGHTAANGSGSSLSITFALTGLSSAPTASIGGVDYTAGALSCNSANTSCSAIVTFLPKTPGPKRDALLLKNASGNLVASAFLHGIGTGPVLRMLPGTLSTVIGSGVSGNSNGNALSASFRDPQGLAFDIHGNIYIADSVNQVIRKFTASTGVVSTVAGNGTAGLSGNGGIATSASLNTPTGVSIDSAGNLYIADQGNSLIRRVDAVSGLITTVAGGGTSTANGVSAITALLYGPNNVANDNAGNIYIADSFHDLVRQVTVATGLITTVAGGGTAAGTDSLGDDGLATAAQLSNPNGIAFDSAGNLYIADAGHSMIRRVDAVTGIITAVAGTGSFGSSGDGTLAINATLGTPTGIRLDASDSLYIADSGTNLIRFVNSSTGIISTIAGKGAAGYAGNGGIATSGLLNSPTDVALGPAGNVLIADYANNVIRKVTFAPPTLTFPSTNLTLTSALVPVTLGDFGNANLTLTSLAIGTGFQQVVSSDSDCELATQVTPGAECQVGLVFAPVSAGAVAGTLTVGSNSLGQPSSQAVNLAGTGISGYPVVHLSASSLSFPSQAVGTVSSALSATLTNIGNAALSGMNIQISGANVSDFNVTTTCGSTLAPGVACAIKVSFTPKLSGTRSAVVSIYDSVTNSPQIVTLSGTGIGGPLPQLNAAVLQFGSEIITYATAAQTVTLTNAGTASLAITSISLSGLNNTDFYVGTSTCGSTLPAAGSCSVTVSFVPTALGSRTTNLLFGDSAGSSPQSVTLIGTGLPLPCSVSLSQTSQIFLAAGGAGTVTVTDSSACPWTATSDVSWVTFPGTFFGSATATLQYTVNPNTTPQPRTGVINIGSQILTVTQTGTGLRFIPVTPCRVADTRNSAGALGGPKLAGQTSRDFPVPESNCGIPPAAQAYSLNVTVVPRGILGYLSIYPTGEVQPPVSTLNSDAGLVKADAVILPAGTNGAVTVFATNATDVVIDINGYFVPETNNSALSFYPLTPCRVADTRKPAGPLGAPYIPGEQVRNFPIQSGPCNVPSIAQAYSLNFTAVPRTGTLSFLSVWPTGQPQPLVSTLNDPQGLAVANAAIVPVGSGGDISAFVTQDSDLVIDINGYFAPPQASGGLSLYNLAPCRAVDTRHGGAAPFSGTITLAIGQNCPLPAQAQAYVLNATVVPTYTLGYLSLWPNGTPQPLVSTLNASDIVSNLAVVPSSNGLVNAYATNSTQLILDLFGYFAP